MRKLFLSFVVLLFSANLFAGIKCEIRGHLIDRKNNRPFSGGFRFEKPGGVLAEYITTDKQGTFVILVKDTGLYFLVYHVGYCKDEKLQVAITDSTPYNLNIDFYTDTWDRNCIADEMLRRPQLIPRLSFMQGWRSMLDASIALRLKTRKKNNYESHSIAIGAEWNYGFRRYLIGYKIGYTYLNECAYFSGFTIGANVVYFADRSNGELYLQPQIAYEIAEVMEIISQYNIPLTSREIDYRVNPFSAGLRFWIK